MTEYEKGWEAAERAWNAVPEGFGVGLAIGTIASSIGVVIFAIWRLLT